MNPVAQAHVERFGNLIQCPACRAGVKLDQGRLCCEGEEHWFSIENGIPRLFVPNDWNPEKLDVTKEVRSFYEKTPFPNYDGFDSVAALIEKSRKGKFARLLDDQVPLGVKVLEVGCGTGQLSNFLGIRKRVVFGVDMCLNSLGLGEDFRKRSHLSRVGFYQMNLFRPIFRNEVFDLVLCNGVLHHTSDPLSGFKSIAPLVKKGGYVLVGLYNKLGRLMTDFRRGVFRLTGRRFVSIDPYIRERRTRNAKTEAWFMDQYKHPHESKHTMGEVLDWFEECGFRFVSSVPKGEFLETFSENEKLFKANRRPDRWTLAAVQTHMILTGNREGGLFIMIGQRV